MYMESRFKKLLTRSPDKIFRKSNTLFLSVSAIFMIIMPILIGVNILMRNLTGVTFVWINELAQTMHIWIVFLGLTNAAASGDHIKLSYFYNKLDDSYQRFLDTGIQLTNLCTVLVIFISSLLAIDAASGADTAAAGIPFLFLYLPATVGMFSLAFMYLRKLSEGVEGYGWY